MRVVMIDSETGETVEWLQSGDEMFMEATIVTMDDGGPAIEIDPDGITSEGEEYRIMWVKRAPRDLFILDDVDDVDSKDS